MSLGPLFWIPVGLCVGVVVLLVLVDLGDRLGWWDGFEDEP